MPCHVMQIILETLYLDFILLEKQHEGALKHEFLVPSSNPKCTMACTYYSYWQSNAQVLIYFTSSFTSLPAGPGFPNWLQGCKLPQFQCMTGSKLLMHLQCTFARFAGPDPLNDNGPPQTPHYN